MSNIIHRISSSFLIIFYNTFLVLFIKFSFVSCFCSNNDCSLTTFVFVFQVFPIVILLACAHIATILPITAISNFKDNVVAFAFLSTLFLFKTESKSENHDSGSNNGENIFNLINDEVVGHELQVLVLCSFIYWLCVRMVGLVRYLLHYFVIYWSIYKLIWSC